MSAPTTVTTALTVRVADAALDPWPLTAEQVLEGSPDARGALLWRSEDNRLANGVWECTPGRFTWSFVWDETATLHRGAATVTPRGGTPLELRAGDLVFFPRGLETEWLVTDTVRKSFHVHAADGLPF
jgi:uncharacterized cupin superfamily protein